MMRIGPRPWLAAGLALGLGVVAVSVRTVQADEEPMSWTLSSSAFEEGQAIPVKYTCDDANLSPPLAWTEPPAATQSFALISDDPDAPRGTWVHWVVYNLCYLLTSSRLLAYEVLLLR